MESCQKTPKKLGIGGGWSILLSSASCLILGILPALLPATPNYKGFASKSVLVVLDHLLVPSSLSYDFVWRILNIFKIFNFYILAVKEAGDSATYEK